MLFRSVADAAEGIAGCLGSMLQVFSEVWEAVRSLRSDASLSMGGPTDRGGVFDR